MTDRVSVGRGWAWLGGVIKILLWGMLLCVVGILLIGLHSFRWNVVRYAQHLEKISINQIDYSSMKGIVSCFIESDFLAQTQTVLWNTIYPTDTDDASVLFQESTPTEPIDEYMYDDFDSFFGSIGRLSGEDVDKSNNQRGFVTQPQDISSGDRLSQPDSQPQPIDDDIKLYLQQLQQRQK